FVDRDVVGIGYVLGNDRPGVGAEMRQEALQYRDLTPILYSPHVIAALETRRSEAVGVEPRKRRFLDAYVLHFHQVEDSLGLVEFDPSPGHIFLSVERLADEIADQPHRTKLCIQRVG